MKIESKEEHAAALAWLGDIEGTPSDHDQFIRTVATAIEAFELEHYPLLEPEPVLCKGCGYYQTPVLTDAGDETCCPKCRAPLP